MITVICGCMFAGKSGELLRILKRHRIAKRSVQVFKPSLDTRDVDGLNRAEVRTREGGSLSAVGVSSVHLIPGLLHPDTQVVAVDEMQFFDGDLRDALTLAALAQKWAGEGRHVVLSGLDMDYQGLPFDTTAMACTVAHRVIKLTAVCEYCGEEAQHTRRLGDDTERLSPGHSYIPVCFKHATLSASGH